MIDKQKQWEKRDDIDDWIVEPEKQKQQGKRGEIEDFFGKSQGKNGGENAVDIDGFPQYFEECAFWNTSLNAMSGREL